MAKVYTKIPGLGTGRAKLQVAMRSRLYQGLDHLLLVQSTGYTEDYKRIFFRDIRFVEVRKTRGQIWQALITGTLTAFLALLHFIPGMPTIAVVLICLPTFVLFIVNLVRGPTCDCYINTQVQTLAVPTPGRIRKVPLLINFLRDQAGTGVASES